MLTELLSLLSQYSLDLIERFGYIGIAVVSFLENVFTPIPSEVVIPFTGVLVAQGKMDPVLVWFAAVTGSIAGSMVFYGLGYWLGTNGLYLFVERWGKWLFISKKDIQKSERWFERFGNISVLIGRLIPQVRSFISIPAGITRMPFWTFVFLTGIGSGIWLAFLEWLGFYFGQNYTAFLPIFRVMDVIVVAVLVILLLYFIYRKKVKTP
jgi:membrane protein DedA with SNARE-associated domain